MKFGHAWPLSRGPPRCPTVTFAMSDENRQRSTVMDPCCRFSTRVGRVFDGRPKIRAGRVFAFSVIDDCRWPSLLHFFCLVSSLFSLSPVFKERRSESCKGIISTVKFTKNVTFHKIHKRPFINQYRCLAQIYSLTGQSHFCLFDGLGGVGFFLNTVLWSIKRQHCDI